jgi:DNA-binding XRE family transcriptional regulator
VSDTAEMQIGGRIKRLRRLRKLAQADLATALGISASYLNLIEHNRRKVTVPTKAGCSATSWKPLATISLPTAT